MSDPKATLLLISGYGRSGSTIVDIETTRRTGGASVGELRYAVDHFARGMRLCSCGVRMADCPFWQALDARGLLTAETVLARVSVPRSLLLLARAPLRGPRELFDAIEAQLGGRTVIVDSSKTTWGSFLRPLLLARALDGRRRSVHLGVFREPMAVYRSMLKGRNEDLALGKSGTNRGVSVRFVVGWLSSNAALLLTHHLYRRAGRETAVRELSQLSARFDVPEALSLPSLSHGAVAEPLLHMAGGNRLQAEGTSNRLGTGQEPSDPEPTPQLLALLTAPMYRRLRRLAEG